MPFKYLQTPGEIAQHLLEQVKPFAKYALGMRQKKCRTCIAEIRHWRSKRTAALAEFAEQGLSSETSIVDYYAEQEAYWIQELVTSKFTGLLDIRNLRRQCRELLLAEASDTSVSPDVYFNLGALCERLNSTRYIDFYSWQKERTQRVASAGKIAQGGWHEELGLRAYFDFWIHGQHLSWREALEKYSDIIPPIKITANNQGRTLTKALLKQRKFYRQYDARVSD
ncbi:hypothetical protein EKG39_03630 [Shewanella atlantica]|uniref:Uncharacterized protein n=2 Tax=Shewanella atlantica TaxID=271099 RepID=A0A431WH92_9GAMM|nr:hypothetical protein EKG39_03630 [Shewanella atlantica]